MSGSRARQSHLGSFFACLSMNEEEREGWASPAHSTERGAPVSPGRLQRLPQRSSTLLINPPLEGFLLKKGAKGITLGWKRRWFVLADQRLYYYKSSDAARHSQLGFIDLRGSYEIEEGHDAERCHFRIRTPERLWFLAADAEEECRFWLEGLRSFKRRQQRFSHNTDTIARLRSESEMRLARDGDIISPEEEMLELKRLLEEAELAVEDKARHVDELYHDLQNSIQIIRLKNNQVDLLSQRLEAKAAEAQRLHELLHKLSHDEGAPSSPSLSPSDRARAVPLARSPPSPLWARNSWQGGQPSGFPLWRTSRDSVSAEHRTDAHSLPHPAHPAHAQPLPAPRPPLDPAPSPSPPVSVKLLYEIRQGEELLPSLSGLSLSDEPGTVLPSPEVSLTQEAPPSPLSTSEFLARLARSMSSYAAFVEGSDHASHEAITYWVRQIKQHQPRLDPLDSTQDVPSMPSSLPSESDGVGRPQRDADDHRPHAHADSHNNDGDDDDDDNDDNYPGHSSTQSSSHHQGHREEEEESAEQTPHAPHENKEEEAKEKEGKEEKKEEGENSPGPAH